MSERHGFPATANLLLRFLSGLLTVSILIQFFIAGMSSLTAPDWWNYHKIWVNIFQWLVLPLPVFAWFCGKPRGGRVLFASLPILEEIISVMPSQRKQGRDDQHQCGIDSMKSDAVR